MAELIAAFEAGAGRVVRDAARNAVADALVDTLAAARAAWPGVDVDPEAFARRLGACAAADEADVDVGLGRLRVSDLYLAHACAAGDERACQHLDVLARPGLNAALRGAGVPATELDDVRQYVLVRLVERRESAPPRIATFGGRSSLERWVRAVGVREARARLQVRQPPSGPGDVGTLVDPAHTPELSALRAEHREAFRRAFESAVQQLEVRERNVLRQSVLDGLSIDSLGELYGVHRSTVARWLERARKRLLELTAASLRDALKLPTAELASMMRLTDSQLHVSLSRVFAADE